MSLPQTLYDIKYIKQITSYLTSSYGVLGALHYFGLWKKKLGYFEEKSRFLGAHFKPHF